MRPRWTRRRFLGATVAGSLASRIASAGPPAAVAALAPAQRASLRAALDEIVPAGEGLPAASEVGALEYLEGLAAREAGVGRDLADVLAKLGDFAGLAAGQRTPALAELERSDARAFGTLRDLVYEAYYTQPAVWQRLGYEFLPPDRSGPPLPDFDESSVKRVKTMGELWRKAP